MLNKKKNAFTITELVIVIAVIAILAAVLIPTFSNVIAKANESAAMQEARTALTEYTLRDEYKGESLEGFVLKSGDYYFYYINGELEMITVSAESPATFEFESATYEISASATWTEAKSGVEFYTATVKTGA